MLLYRRPPVAAAVQWRYFGSTASDRMQRPTGVQPVHEALEVRESDLAKEAQRTAESTDRAATSRGE